MTPVEFKNWFDGYTEQIVGAPSVGQWVRIVEQFQKVAWSAVTLGGIPNGNPLGSSYRITSGVVQQPIGSGLLGGYSIEEADRKAAEMRRASLKHDANGGALLGTEFSSADVVNGAAENEIKARKFHYQPDSHGDIKGE